MSETNWIEKAKKHLRELDTHKRNREAAVIMAGLVDMLDEQPMQGEVPAQPGLRPTHHIQSSALVQEPSEATLACLAAVQPDPWGVTTHGQIVVALLNRVSALERAMGEVDEPTHYDGDWPGQGPCGCEKCLLAQIAKLESWKESAILTLNDWDAVAEKVPYKPSNLGMSKSAVVGEYIDEASATLTDQLQAAKLAAIDDAKMIGSLDKTVKHLTEQLTRAQKEIDRLEPVIEDRDRYESQANDMATLIGRLLGEDFGEHSNRNCPIANAIEAAEAAAKMPKQAALAAAKKEAGICPKCSNKLSAMGRCPACMVEFVRKDLQR